VINVDEKRLEFDPEYRFKYLAAFIGFGDEDVQAIKAATKQLTPMIPWLVNAIYEKLLSQDATRRHFLPPQSGFEGEAPRDVADLTYDHPVIKFRKDKFTRYLTQLLSGPYDASTVAFLTMVGQMHTPKAGAKTLVVPLVQMNALMGFIADTIQATLFSLQLPVTELAKTLRAYNKLLWIQSDLITRHYQDAANWVIA
jgi:hypothetical protein